MSLPGGKAIYLIAFSLPLSYIRKLTDQLATHITYCLFMLIFCADICFFPVFIYIFALSLKQMSNLILNFMKNFYLCSIQSKTNPNANDTFVVPIGEISEFVSSNLRRDCILIISACSTFKAIPDEK